MGLAQSRNLMLQPIERVSAFAMALGTGAFISLVAISAATARGATIFAAGVKHAGIAVPLLQLFAGIAIALVASAFLVAPFVAKL